MKLRFAVLIALAVMFSAGLAKADPVDPTVIINDPPPLAVSTACPTNVICFSFFPAIVLQLTKGFFLSPTSFEYIGPSLDKGTLFVVLDDILPGETFTCASSTFMSCELILPDGDHDKDDNWDLVDHDGDSVVFAFTVSSLHPLQTGATLSASVVPTPEPSLMCQLLIGILPLLFFGRKYWATDQAA